jgi:hypothetical protein
MRTLEDFRIYYNHTIHPELMRLEQRRKRLLILLFISSLLLVGIILFELYLNILVITLVLMIPIGLYISYLLYRIRRFVITFKPLVVNLILDFIDDGINYGTLEYYPEKTIEKKVFDDSHIFETPGDVYQGEDFITGKIGDLQFEMCELNVREMSKVRSRLNYVFRGIFMHTTFNQSINGTVLILPRNFRQYLSRTIRNISGQGGRNIDNLMKHKEFRNQFLTYSTRNAMVRNILSEYMQKTIVEYQEKTEKEIYLSLIKRKLFVAITEPKNILEPFVFRSNVSFELVREFFEDIQLMLHIIEDFEAHT